MRFHTFPKVQASSPAGPMLASSRIGLVLVPLLVSSLPNGVVVISPYLRAGLRAYMSPSPFSARLWGGEIHAGPYCALGMGLPTAMLVAPTIHTCSIGIASGPFHFPRGKVCTRPAAYTLLVALYPAGPENASTVLALQAPSGRGM